MIFNLFNSPENTYFILLSIALENLQQKYSDCSLLAKIKTIFIITPGNNYIIAPPNATRLPLEN